MARNYEVEVEIAEDDTQPRMYPAYVPPQSSAANGAPVAPAAGPRPLPAGTEVVADESKVCRSPIAGVVIRCNAQIGQQIQPNDLLMVVEAMKMETNVTAPVGAQSRTSGCNPATPFRSGRLWLSSNRQKPLRTARHSLSPCFASLRTRFVMSSNFQLAPAPEKGVELGGRY